MSMFTKKDTYISGSSLSAGRSSGDISFVNIGTSLLLVVFLVLCLVTFAVLSLSTAQADYNLSSDQAEHTTLYYAACSKAEALLAEIDDALAEGEDGNDIVQLLDSESALNAGYDKDTDCVSFSVDVSDEQMLNVVLCLDSSTGHNYDITTWEVVSSKQWTAGSNTSVFTFK